MTLGGKHLDARLVLHRLMVLRVEHNRGREQDCKVCNALGGRDAEVQVRSCCVVNPSWLCFLALQLPVIPCFERGRGEFAC